LADPKTYRRVGSRGRSLAAAHSAWLAPDHLLLVETAIGRERYRRIRFDEIQAVSLASGTGSFVRGLLTWALVLVLFALPLLLVESMKSVFWAIPLGIPLVGLIRHLWLGSTCAVQLRTAVEAVPIRAWRRTRTTRKALTELRALVEQHQGAAIEPAEVAEPGRVVPIFKTASEREKPVRGPMHLKSYYFVIAALVGESVAATLQALTESAAIDFVGLITFSILAIAALTAVVRNSGSTVPQSLRRWGGGVLAFTIVEFFAISALSFVEAIESGLNSEAFIPSGFGSAEYVFVAIGLLLAGVGLVLIREVPRR